MEIVPGLHRLLGPKRHGVNAFLHTPPNGDGPLLFDCGWPWSGQSLISELRRLGVPPAALSAVFVTHDDVDHTGGLPSLNAVARVSLYAHEFELPRLSALVWRDVPGGSGRVDWINLAARVIYGLWPHPPVTEAIAFKDGDELLGGWRAYHTPGHTPGHASYYNAAIGVLIAGDALGPLDRRRLRAPKEAYSEDLPATRQSVKKLAALRPDVVCCGHGSIISQGAQALDELVQRLETAS